MQNNQHNKSKQHTLHSSCMPSQHIGVTWVGRTHPEQTAVVIWFLSQDGGLGTAGKISWWGGRHGWAGGMAGHIAHFTVAPLFTSCQLCRNIGPVGKPVNVCFKCKFWIPFIFFMMTAHLRENMILRYWVSWVNEVNVVFLWTRPTFL